ECRELDRLFLHRNAVGDFVVLVARNNATVEQFVFARIRTAGDDAIGGGIVDPGQAGQLLFGGVIQVDRLVRARMRQSLADALGHGFGIVLHLVGGIGGLLTNLLRTLWRVVEAGVATGKPERQGAHHERRSNPPHAHGGGMRVESFGIPRRTRDSFCPCNPTHLLRNAIYFLPRATLHCRIFYAPPAHWFRRPYLPFESYRLRAIVEL